MKKIEKKQKFDPPQETNSDIAHSIVKVILTPILGAPELFERFIEPSLQKRTAKWMEDVAQALRNLEENQGIKLEALQNNEQFITILTQATSIAIKNHQEEKLLSLKNAITNSIINPNFDDISLTFIRFIDELTPSHLYLLKVFINNEEKLRKLKSYLSIYELVSVSLSNPLSRDQFKMLIGDLSVRGLIQVSQDTEDFEGMYQADALLAESTNDDLPRLLVTDIAKTFIAFISEHK